MRARYSIYPDRHYILETFSGAVRFTRLEQFLLHQQTDPRIARSYHTVSDYSSATLHLSVEEVVCIADMICKAPDARMGKRALVISGVRNFGFVDILRSVAGRMAIDCKYFIHRDAALTWVMERPPRRGKEMTDSVDPLIMQAPFNDQRGYPIADAMTVFPELVNPKEL